MKSATLKPARIGKSVYLLATALSVLLFSVSLLAQGNFGRILGTVTDQTGAVISGAAVSVIDTERGIARSLVTDAAGEYNAPNLTPSTYTVRVQVNGFKTLDRPNIVLEVGKEIRVDLTPQPGEQNQTVTVEAAAPLVDATSATLGGTLGNADINDMPLNGRNYQNLLNLRPGVMIQPGGSPWTQSTNNVRPDESVWLVDGVFNANFQDRRPIANMPSPFTDGATILPIDAIQEFNLTENPKAESGFSPGAVVNVGIRSGTNNLHGSAYAFGRDVDWDARNLFNPPPNDKTPTELEQFGGVLGGPIKKDKLFYFGGYEGLRSFIGNAFILSFPETAAQPKADPTNSMVDAIKALQAHGVTPSPVSLALFGCTTTGAPCTGGLVPTASQTTTVFGSNFPNTNTSDNGIGKINYLINSKHLVNGTAFIGKYLGNGIDHPVVASYWTNPDPISTYTIGSSWIWTASSSTVNELRYGYNLVNFALFQADQNKFANGKDYPLNTGVTSVGGFPNVEISGFAPLGGWRGRPVVFQNPYHDIQDNLSYLHGRHAFKFGVDYTHIYDNYNIYDKRGRIQFRGNKTGAFTCPDPNDPTKQVVCSTPLEDFFAGNPTRAYVLIGDTDRQFTWHSLAGFAQDDWRIARRLMLNLGLRYSYVSPIHEINNLFGNFDPKLGLVQQGQPSVGGTLIKPDYKDFSPRVGFAWDVTGKGTTIVRGGASVMYSMFSVAQFTQSGQQNFGGTTGLHVVQTGACTTSVTVGTPCPGTFGGTIQLGNATIPGKFLNWNGVVYPAGASLFCTGSNPPTASDQPCNFTTVDPNLKTPYIVNWHFGVQHAFNNNLSLEVGYVANHGDNLTGFIDINQLDPVTGTRPFQAKFPYLQFINRTVNDARSNYNSLQSTLTKRVSHGLSFTAGYTYGHGLDNGSLSRFGNLPQNSLNPGAEYASSDFDVRHRFTLTASYEIPGKNGYGQLLKGWKLNTIVNLQSGQPWLLDDTQNDFSGQGVNGGGDLADRWNFYGNPSDFTSSGSSIPYCTGGGPKDCSVTSGVSGIQSFFSDSATAAMWAKCTSVAPDPTTLAQGGCFLKGKSVMVPPKAGTYGTMGRNTLRDGGFRNMDLSLFKNFTFKERYGVQFRWELFNVFNHPIVANPYGASNGSGLGIDPGASPSTFGCGCATPDVAAGNPLVGSGSSRVMQLGLKFTF
jgi:Carboxypeptidase regulatory-like domain/TonB dependent receptor